MIRTTILTLAVGLTLSAPSLAQEDGKKRGPAAKRPTPEQVKRFDKNGDGKLDEAERKAMREAVEKKGGEDDAKRREELLKRFDENGDGKLDDAERKALREHIAKERKERAGEKGKGGEEGKGGDDA